MVRLLHGLEGPRNHLQCSMDRPLISSPPPFVPHASSQLQEVYNAGGLTGVDRLVDVHSPLVHVEESGKG